MAMNRRTKRNAWLALGPGLAIALVTLSWSGRAAADADAGVDAGPSSPPVVAAGETEPEGEESPEWTGPPVDVTVGLYLNQMREVSLHENEFQADFWIWFRWAKGTQEIDPLASFEVIGGNEVSKDNEVRQDLGQFHYAACRVRVTITKFFDVRAFPQDHHEVAIVVEDSENEDHKIRYVADRANTRIDPDVEVPGFVITRSQTRVSSHTYRSNYGDVTLPSNSESRYSRFELKIQLARPGLGYSLKLLWGLWLSALIAFIPMFIKPIDVDPRFGLGVGAIFAAMANAYIISSALPDTNQVTTADEVNMLTIAFIFLSVLESTISLNLYQNGKEALSKRIDRISFVAMLVLYTAGTVYALS